MRILLTGKTGQVGFELEHTLAPLGTVVAMDRASLDLSSAELIREKVASESPDVIVNAAAYTAVDRAESEPDAAFAVNARAPGALAAAAAKQGALLVHFSTDYVFDGEKTAPYVETDPTAPLGVYGKSKLEGERAVAASGCRHFIFRTSWVYGARGRNFLRAILAAAREKPELRVVNDQRGAPTSSGAIAAAVAQVLGGAWRERPSGIYHLTAAGETTWHGFASEIVAAAGLKIPVRPISTAEFPTAAKRPKNSLLSNTRLAQTFGVALADWRLGFREVSSKISG